MGTRWSWIRPGLIPPLLFDDDRQAEVFSGEPLIVAGRIWRRFVAEADIDRHLVITLAETTLAFVGAAVGE